jgi:flagellar basal body P-ring formation protein FlgA
MRNRPLALFHGLPLSLWLGALLGCLTPTQALADAPWSAQVQRFVLDAVRHQMPGQRVQVQVGPLDARLRLAPCERTEPYLAGATRLWGQSRVGLRCVQGQAAWNVFVPVTVKVFGVAQVAATALPAGSVIRPGDLTQAEVDLAESASNAIVDPTRAAGRTLARAVPAGHTLREAHLRPRIWFAAGDDVRLVARGGGFAAVTTGQALTPGVDGQPARARTDSGRVVMGAAVAHKEIDLTQ